MVSVTVGYHWHLRRLMAEAGMFATTDLVPLLAERGVALSREQVYRLVTGVPERLSLATLAALCDILGCGPGDLVEPVVVTPAGTPETASHLWAEDPATGRHRDLKGEE
jgi:DNA-binding Xre family transcriptional regulator